jgi:epidermal growth factor receptor substrate 15
MLSASQHCSRNQGPSTAYYRVRAILRFWGSTESKLIAWLGTIARDIFQRSKLPTATLIQIWNLADRQGRGALGAVEFIVAMHLITCCKNGSLLALPRILPPGLFDAAAGRQSTRNGRQTGRVMPPVPPIPKQFSGPQAQRAQSPLSRNFTPPVPQSANAVQRDLTGGWVVSPADKQRFDAVFLTVDKANRGFITGRLFATQDVALLLTFFR